MEFSSGDVEKYGLISVPPEIRSKEVWDIDGRSGDPFYIAKLAWNSLGVYRLFTQVYTPILRLVVKLF